MTYWSIDNNWANLVGVSDQDAAQLYMLLRVRPKGYFFDYRYRSGMWDGYVYYYDSTRKRVLAGLLDIIDEMGFNWERRYVTEPIIVTNEIPTLTLDSATNVTYAAKQVEALQLIKDGKNRGIFDMITGLGKTCIISGITKMLGKRTMIIVPGIDLLNQTVDEVKRFTGIECGKIGGGFNDENHRIKVVVDDTLKRLPKWRLEKLAADVEVLIMDEVHNCTDKLLPFIQMCKDTYFRYGFSGSPFDMGKDRALSIIGSFGPVLSTADAKDLVDSKRGVPAHFIFINSVLPKSGAPDYVQLYADCIVDNFVYHNQLADIIQKHSDGNTSILVLVRRVSHGVNLQKCLQKQGIDCEFTCGKHDGGKRGRVKERFKQGELKVLVASDIYKEGVDLPCIDILVLAGAGESMKDWRQRVGRGLRAHPGKDKVIVYDFNFIGNKIFENHSKERLKRALALPEAQVFKLESILNEPILLSVRKT